MKHFFRFFRVFSLNFSLKRKEISEINVFTMLLMEKSSAFCNGKKTRKDKSRSGA